MAPMARWTTPMIVFSLAGTVTMAGCSSDPKEQPTPTPSVTLDASSAHASPTSPRQAAEQAALTAYRNMLKAYTDAGRTSDPQHPDLARYAAENALQVLVVGLESAKKDGLVTEGDMVASPEVADLQPPEMPTQASIRDCLDTTNSHLVKASPGGSPFTDTPGGRRRVTATVKVLDGQWKVTTFYPYEVGTC